MAVADAGSALPELPVPKKLWRDREKSTTTTATTTTSPGGSRRVPVVYYLSRNGHLEHPHFMEVPLSNPDGLYLQDVINRLNLLRGTGMAALYSWSSKRSYKNGFVWQDLVDNDFIHPSHGNEYVLKGSELLQNAPPQSSASSSSSRPLESVSFRSPKPTEAQCEESSFPVAVRRRRNQSWSSIDLQEYKVYKTEMTGDFSRRPAADASTQTDDRRRRGRRPVKVEPEKKESETTELTRDENAPPPSDSSPETLETLLKSQGRLALSSSANNNASGETLDRAAGGLPSGRMKASTVLMQLITCGSFSIRDCGAAYVKDQGLSLIGHCKPTAPNGAGNNVTTSNSAAASAEMSRLSRVKLEEKEYFSGSLVETASKKLEVVPALKRSSSYNADGSSSGPQMQLGEKDMEDGVPAKCIPRKLRVQQPTKKAEHEQEQSIKDEVRA